jgi:glycine cleavage system transcriptional repressor
MASHTALVSIMCEDRPGLIADVAGRLYELGINLGDTTFAVLGSGAKLTLVAKLPSDISIPDVEEDLRAMPVLRGADLEVAPFAYRVGPHHPPDRDHRR